MVGEEIGDDGGSGEGEKYEGVVAGVAAGEGWAVVVVGVRATG